VLPLELISFETTSDDFDLEILQEEVLARNDALSYLAQGKIERDFMERYLKFIYVLARLSGGCDSYTSLTREKYDEIKRFYIENLTIQGAGSFRDIVAFTAADILGFEYSTILLPLEDSPQSFAQMYTTITLSKIPLIDVSRASWAQIMSLREDSEAQSRLRRLRLFMSETYVGKSRTFIEDDLHQRIETYESVRKSY